MRNKIISIHVGLIFLFIFGLFSIAEGSQPLEQLLRIDALKRGGEVVVPPGEWFVSGHLIIPRTLSLRVQTGASLRLLPGSTLRVEGPFAAPENRVFSDIGKVRFSGSMPREVSPTWWGTRGDGSSDDTGGIQMAIDSLDQGEVNLRQGTYMIGPTKKVPEIVFLTVKPNITLTGAGMRKTVLKVRNNVGPYHYIFSAPTKSTDCSHLRIQDLTIDSNIENNPLQNEQNIKIFPRMSIALFNSSDIVIDRVEFINESSINTVSLNGVKVQQVSIINCRFNNIGDDPNQVRHDHSSIYTHANGVVIRGNEFRSAGIDKPGARTAIETHGSDTLVEGNRITDYSKGMNITGVSHETSRNVTVRRNQIINANYGILLWSYKYRDHKEGFGFDGVNILGNQIFLRQTKYSNHRYSSGIFINPGSDLPLRALHIDNNTIKFELESLPGNSTPDSFGIGYRTSNGGWVEESSISNNTIMNSPASGIRFNCVAKGLEITGNTIVNPGTAIDKSLPNQFRVGIYIALDQLEKVVIKGNSISDTLLKARMVGGIFLGQNASPPGVVIAENRVIISEKNPSSFRGNEISNATWH